mgnify:CR=1 FL=1
MEEIIVENEELKTGVNVIFDYFSCTFPFICYADDFELLIVNDVLKTIVNFLGFDSEDVYKEDYAKNRFKHEYTISNLITLRINGASLKSGHPSCQIELKGDGCRLWESKNPDKTWMEFLEFFIVRLNGSPTRIDLTIDDYDGASVTMPWLRERLERGSFISSFNQNKFYVYGNDEDGWSINFGKNGASQQLCIYEKNKERIAKNKRCIQPYWLRFEMRYRGDKAYDLAMNLLNMDKTKTLQEYAKERLYYMLDFKDENNITYNREHYNLNPTDVLWLEFLDNVEKTKLLRYKIHNSTYMTYCEYMEPKIASFIISRLFINNKNIYATLSDLINIALKDFDSFDKKKINRINVYLSELKCNRINESDLEDLKIKLRNEYEYRTELPF